jgi:hypothetical protein
MEIAGQTYRPRRIRKNLSGKTFGKLYVVGPSEFIPKTYNSNTLYDCICGCGNTHMVYGDQLTRGKTKSCGCTPKPTLWTSETAPNRWANRKEENYAQI